MLLSFKSKAMKEELKAGVFILLSPTLAAHTFSEFTDLTMHFIASAYRLKSESWKKFHSLPSLSPSSVFSQLVVQETSGQGTVVSSLVRPHLVY